jgi:hypothetical protein
MLHQRWESFMNYLPTLVYLYVHTFSLYLNPKYTQSYMHINMNIYMYIQVFIYASAALDVVHDVAANTHRH